MLLCNFTDPVSRMQTPLLPYLGMTGLCYAISNSVRVSIVLPGPTDPDEENKISKEAKEEARKQLLDMCYSCGPVVEPYTGPTAQDPRKRPSLLFRKVLSVFTGQIVLSAWGKRVCCQSSLARRPSDISAEWSWKTDLCAWHSSAVHNSIPS